MRIERANGLLATAGAISPSNFKTGARTGARNGARPFWMPRREGVMTLSILYFKHAKKDDVVVILKAREPARIMIAIGAEDRWHLQLAQRWIVQYNFYINDQNWGRMFVRICPYLPFSARVCLNQHHWLANRMRCQGIDFK